MLKTYHGSCHCKVVTFEVDVDLEKGTSKCNCTFCWKQRMWTVSPDPDALRLTSGEDALGDYSKSGEWGEGHHRFCSRCGINTHAHGDIPAIGGRFLSVQLSTLNDLPVEDILAAPVSYQDGRHDDWLSTPSETRHL